MSATWMEELSAFAFENAWVGWLALTLGILFVLLRAGAVSQRGGRGSSSRATDTGWW